MKVGTLNAVFVAIGALLVGGPSLAQNSSEVTVEAAHVEKTTQNGPMGRPQPALSIVYRVSYSDLNISTNSGAVELQKRIKDSATQACAQLVKLYPDSTEGETPCVQGAVKNAMEQAKKAIAAAEKARS